MTKPTEDRSQNIKRINAWLAINGLDMKLVRDRSGYFYFTGADANVWVSGVYVYRQDHLPIERWAEEAITAIDFDYLTHHRQFRNGVEL